MAHPVDRDWLPTCACASSHVHAPPLPCACTVHQVDHYWLNLSAWRGVGKPPNAGYGGGFNLSARGIGNDRGAAYGATYCPRVAERLARPATTPPRLLLTFHHLPFDRDVGGGVRLLAALRGAYKTAAAWASEAPRRWAGLEGLVDAPRHALVAERLAAAAADAARVRDAALAFLPNDRGG